MVREENAATANSVNATGPAAATANSLKASAGTTGTATADSLKAPAATTGTATADSLKAPTRSARAPRCALPSLRSVQCLRRRASPNTSPLSFPPAQTVEPADVGGNERGWPPREGGRRKHRRREWNERRGAQRGHRAPCARLLEGPSVPRCPRPERPGAFTLLVVTVFSEVASLHTPRSRPAKIDFGPSPGTGVNDATAAAGVW